MKQSLSAILPIFLTLSLSYGAFGETPQPPVRAQSLSHSDLSSLVSYQEFIELTELLSKKVNLFRDAWAMDPNIEFFGGTSRDFVYWVKGQFQGISTREEALKKYQDLMQLPVIDVRSFIINESDVDVISKGKVKLDPSLYGVKKIDSIVSDRLDPKTEAGQDEVKQGYIPVEKIRLGTSGFLQSSQFGDGLKEIYEGHPTVHYADPREFASTHFAKLHLNHPVLLAARFLRILASDYFHKYGKSYPDLQKLMDIDAKSAADTKAVIRTAMDSEELRLCLTHDKFIEWANGSVQKGFRSYTNQTAAQLIFNEFGMNRLIESFPQLETTNQYLFAKYRDEEALKKNREQLGVTDGVFADPKTLFPELTIFHGTKEEDFFHSILLQGVLPSSQGSAGAGLYAVWKDHLETAVARAGSQDRVVKFQVSPQAVVLDITKDPGKSIFEKYSQKYGDKKFDDFADYLGVDILVYPNTPVALVVKNGAVLSRAQGLTRQIMGWAQIKEKLSESKNTGEILELISSAYFNRYTPQEMKKLISEVQDPELRWFAEAFCKAIDTVSWDFRGQVAQLIVSTKDDSSDLLGKAKHMVDHINALHDDGMRKAVLELAHRTLKLRRLHEQSAPKEDIDVQSKLVINWLFEVACRQWSWLQDPNRLTLKDPQFRKSVSAVNRILKLVSGAQGQLIMDDLTKVRPDGLQTFRWEDMKAGFRAWPNQFFKKGGWKNLWPVVATSPMIASLLLTSSDGGSRLLVATLWGEMVAIYVVGVATKSLFDTMSAYFQGLRSNRFLMDSIRQMEKGAFCSVALEKLE